jgi:hypothetical protein
MQNENYALGEFTTEVQCGQTASDIHIIFDPDPSN